MDLKSFKQTMRELAQYDKNKKQAQISAPTLAEALKQASIELTLPINEISYEILQRGKKGLFGVGQQECVIIAYKTDNMGSFVDGPEADFAQFSIHDEVNLIEDVDSKFAVRCLNEKVFLRVKPPEGNGKKSTISDIEKILMRRGISQFNHNIAQNALDLMDEEEVIIGSFVHNNASDAMLDIRISEDEMAAFFILTEPGTGGEELTENSLYQFIQELRIVEGVDADTITDIVNYPDYKNEILFAQGTLPLNGENSEIEYQFETDVNNLMPKEVDGRVDFKNLNLIQNVIEGQVLAKKKPASEGIDGYTVTGQSLVASDGEDFGINIGDNVVYSDDDNTIVAEKNGQVLLSETGRISVAPVYLVSGDVNIKNGGNIDFIGAVVIQGSVEDGYSVKASKDIEIKGTVGKSKIISGGNIIVSQGIAGKEDGFLSCEGNLIAKFVENTKVVTKGDVIVRDSIVNARIDSNSSIICLDGKRAAIVGGHMRASKKVVAKTIGSVSGSETIIEVGFEPEKRERYEELNSRIEKLSKEMAEIDLNLKTVDNNPKMKANLSPEKIENLKKLRIKKVEFSQDFKTYSEEYQEIKEYLDSLKAEGTISVEGRVYPGTRLNISGAEFKVRTELKWTTFYKEGPIIRFKEFSEVRDVN